MHIFVTGASGWVGHGLVPDLIAAGHTVAGLARTDAAARAVQGMGAKPVPGTLDDLETLRAAAADADGVIHLAFRHDIAFAGDYLGATDTDRAAITALGETLAGSDRPLVIASGILGVLGLPPGTVATERDGSPDAGEGPISGGNGRIANAHYVLALAEQSVRSSVVRLPPATHGDGDNGFVATAVGRARDTGAAVYVGDGTNRWPAVHRNDAARLFRLALEAAPAGSVLHAVGDEGVPIRDVATAIAVGLDLPVRSVTAEEAGAHLGWLAGFWATDGPASAQLTRELLGWQPAGPRLIEDLRQGHYFR
ncbi:SDR family oxidoreductase [Dactylosporangium sp. CS-047395]|uniref:SDR family oxidoreductase n=1 Tax=Dactylosporangium sp. CS-047395 TaxID=3239936 RepID=UPI003D949F9C